MIKCANEQCPTILSQTVIRGDESESVAVEDDLRSSCKEKNQISNEFVHTTITEQAGADIINRVKYSLYLFIFTYNINILCTYMCYIIT